MKAQHRLYVETVDFSLQEKAWDGFPFCCEFSARLLANLYVPKSGTYQFFLTSNDGSNLYLDEKLLINNNKVQAMSEKSNYYSLSQGWHEVQIDYFESNQPEQVC